jgi:hypothetical protein
MRRSKTKVEGTVNVKCLNLIEILDHRGSLGVRFSKEEEQTKKWLVSIAEDNGYKVIEEENFVAVFKPNEIKSL